MFDLKVVERGSAIDLWFLGKGFLKQMIRIQVGTLVDLALGRNNGDHIPTILKKLNRDDAGQTAPAKGLSLVEIFYNQVKPLDQILEELKEDYFFPL